jgi:hypothetical protein
MSAGECRCFLMRTATNYAVSQIDGAVSAKRRNRRQVFMKMGNGSYAGKEDQDFGGETVRTDDEKIYRIASSV